MSAEIIPFDFDEQAVRVVMRGDDPWFVAADVCRVLEIGNPSDAVARLDEDERDRVNLNTLDSTEGIRGNPNATIISESGLYALILTSRKPEARRFRKWVTAEVLPALRRSGSYALPAAAPEGIEADAVAGLPFRQAELWLGMVREARLTRGVRAAQRIWDRSPLPILDAAPQEGADEGRACLSALLDVLCGQIVAARDGQAEAAQALAGQGLRCGPDGLFVANFDLAALRGTRWAGGAHRIALRRLPRVVPEAHPRTLLNQRTRGLLLPWALVDAAISGEDAA